MLFYKFNSLKCSLFFNSTFIIYLKLVESRDIYFQDVSEDVFLAWCIWLSLDKKGTFYKSNDIEPIGRNKEPRDSIYTQAEKKAIKPNADTIAMYATSNKKSEAVVDLLMTDFSRILQPVDISGDSFYDAILYQISHDQHKYKAYQFYKQIAYYMVRWPELFADVVKPHLSDTDDSYESFVKNIFYGYSYPVPEVISAVITKMWNVSISLCSAEGGVKKLHHNSNKPDVVIVHNDCILLNSQFTATKKANVKWAPLRCPVWSSDVKKMNNVKNAAMYAEKKYRTRTAKDIMGQYNTITKELNSMKQKVVLYNNQIESMQEKVYKWAKNISLMEANQAVL